MSDLVATKHFGLSQSQSVQVVEKGAGFGTHLPRINTTAEAVQQFLQACGSRSTSWA